MRAPQWYVQGALVGIQGLPIDAEATPWALPPGDKGTIVREVGQVPSEPDLYEAQRRWWAQR